MSLSKYLYGCCALTSFSLFSLFLFYFLLLIYFYSLWLLFMLIYYTFEIGKNSHSIFWGLECIMIKMLQLLHKLFRAFSLHLKLIFQKFLVYMNIFHRISISCFQINDRDTLFWFETTVACFCVSWMLAYKVLIHLYSALTFHTFFCNTKEYLMQISAMIALLY